MRLETGRPDSKCVALNQVKDDGVWVRVVAMRMVGGFGIGFGRKADRNC